MRSDCPIYWGTAGWFYDDWQGIVYPDKRKGLAVIATLCDLVEINTSFYRIPSASLVKKWQDTVLGFSNFQFTAKLHHAFTHQRQYTDADHSAVCRAFSPLQDTGQLAGLLMQFPWSFRYSEAALDYLVQLHRLFPDFPLVLEVRHGSWDQPELPAFLTERAIAFCNIDQPQIAQSLGPSALATASTAYIRLHGRNAQHWFDPNAKAYQRYDYLYSESELSEWVPRIQALTNTADRVIVVTNNHYRGQALVNLIQLHATVDPDWSVVVPTRLLEIYPGALSYFCGQGGQLPLF